MVASMHIYLDCNFFITILIANKISCQKTYQAITQLYNALIKLSTPLFVFASLSQHSYNSNKTILFGDNKI